MTALFRWGVVVGSAAAMPLAAAQAPVFRAGADAVLVDVAVRDGNRPIAHLTAGDFELTDNGVAQTVIVSSLENVPLDLTFVLDTSGSVEGRRLEQLKAGLRDASQQLHDDDRWRVIVVEHVLREIVPLQPAGALVPLDGLQATGGTALFDGLVAAMVRPSAAQRRQIIVAYTDGDDESSIVDEAALLDVARLSEAVVHLVVPVANAGAAAGATLGPVRDGRTADNMATRAQAMAQNTRPDGAELFPHEQALREVATRTGGRLFVVDLKAAIGKAFENVLDDYRTSYVLQYTRQGVAREGWHDIAVRVRRSGHFDVRSRKGYWGG